MCLLKQRGAKKYRVQRYYNLNYPPIWIESPYVFFSLSEAHAWMQRHSEIGTRFRIIKEGQYILSGTK